MMIYVCLTRPKRDCDDIYEDIGEYLYWFEFGYIYYTMITY